MRFEPAALQIFEKHRSDGRRFCFALSHGEITVVHSGTKAFAKQLICSMPLGHEGDHVDSMCCWRSHRFTADMAGDPNPGHRNTERCVECGKSWPCDVARLAELAEADPVPRALVLVSQFEVGDRLVYVVVAGEPPYTVGEEILLDDWPYEVIGVEMYMTNPPKPVINGHQGLMLAALPATERTEG